MTDYEIVNRKTKKVSRVLREVTHIKPIPNDFVRVFFKIGSCKINAETYDTLEIIENKNG
jgi:hypothetical protein